MTEKPARERAARALMSPALTRRGFSFAKLVKLLRHQFGDYFA
jgi:hypothetical protein